MSFHSAITLADECMCPALPLSWTRLQTVLFSRRPLSLTWPTPAAILQLAMRLSGDRSLCGNISDPVRTSFLPLTGGTW